MMKKIFLFLAVVFLLLPDSGGAVKVSRVMLKNGGSFRATSGNTVVLECLLENPDARSHTAELLLQVSEGHQEENVNSWQVFLPAKSSIYFRGDAKIGAAEKYELTVFCDKVRQGRSSENAVQIQVQGSLERMVGIWNDSGNPPGNFSKHPLFNGKLYPVSFNKHTFPASVKQLQDCSMLIIVQPDYENYTAKDYSLILEYAANGGRVIFMDPRGILHAAKTPLEILLPVIPVGIRKCGNGKYLSRIWKGIGIEDFEDGKETEILQSFPRNKNTVVFAEFEKMPLFCEAAFGAGVVRVLAFSPEDEALTFHRDRIGEKALSLLCAVPGSLSSESAMHIPLDMLTGFSVLSVSVVRNILIAYFVLLLVVIWAAHFLKRPVAGWILCGIFAIVAAGVIMGVAAKRTGNKSANLTAAVVVGNVCSPEMTKSCISHFVSKETFRTITGETTSSFHMLGSPKSVFGFGGADGYFQGKNSGFYRVEPIKAVRDIYGRGGVQMTIFPKSSKRYTEIRSGKDLFAMPEKLVLPEISLSGKGMQISPWQLPEAEKAEGLFYIFPGRSCSGSISSSGECSAELAGNMLLSDPMTESLRKSTDSLEQKNVPLLAAVFPFETEKIAQGKKILLYPVRIRVKERALLIPTELIALSSSNHTSRMLFENGRLRQEYDIMADNSLGLDFTLPGFCRNMVPEEIVIKLDHTGKDYVDLLPYLKLPGKNNLLKGKKTDEENSFVFRGEALKKVFDADTISGKLIIESPLNSTGRALSISGSRQILWKLRDIELSVKGKLPESTVLPFVY